MFNSKSAMFSEGEAKINEIVDRIIDNTARFRCERKKMQAEEKERMDRFENKMKQRIHHLQVVADKAQSAEKESLSLEIRKIEHRLREHLKWRTEWERKSESDEAQFIEKQKKVLEEMTEKQRKETEDYKGFMKEEFKKLDLAIEQRFKENFYPDS